MYIFTTIYCTELKLDDLNQQELKQEAAIQAGVSLPNDASREFLGVYQGKSRVNPANGN